MLCLPFILSAFKPILLKHLALPGALLVCLVASFTQRPPSIRFWDKAGPVQNQKPPHHSWRRENAASIVACTQALSLWEVRLKWMRQTRVVASKATILLWAFLVEKSWAALLLESEENKRQIGGRLQVSWTRDSHLAPPGCAAGHLLFPCRFGFARLTWKRLFIFSWGLWIKNT